MTLEEIFIAPLQYEFMREAIFAAILAGLTSGVVGAFVVVRGMSLYLWHRRIGIAYFEQYRQ